MAIIDRDLQNADDVQYDKQGQVTIDPVENGEQNNGFVAHAYTPTPQNADRTMLRRLFSFVQLLAFSLTFMESWEVMAM